MGEQVRRSGDEPARASTRESSTDGLTGLGFGFVGLAVWAGAKSLYTSNRALALALALGTVALVVVGSWSLVHRYTPVAGWERAARACALVALVVLVAAGTGLSLILT